MRKTTSLIIITLLMLTLFACNSDNGENGDTPVSTEPSATNPYLTPAPSPTNDISEPADIDPTGGLQRDADGILVGSAVLEEPVLMMGMGVDPVVVINVRDGPSIEANRLTTIGRGEVVEATEIVNGWYSITVFSDMTDGYIRSDLLVPYVSPDSELDYVDDIGGGNQFTGADPSGLLRGADGVLIGSTEFDRPMRLMGMGSGDLVVINVRENPSIDAERVRCQWGTVTIGKGQMVEAFGVEDGWYRVIVHPGRFEGYIRSDLLVPYDEAYMFLASDIINYDTQMSPTAQLIASGPLVDIRTMIPDIEYELVFATPDNYTGATQYSRDIPLLQLGTAEKLRAAQELFRQDGYRIKLYDAYRPSSVSGRLFASVGDSRYVARAGTSMHNRATAVDITLVDENGVELEMPSPIMTLNSSSHRDSRTMSDAARENMNYMTRIMQQVGMSEIISTEWWHFADSESSRYLPLDIEFRDMAITRYG